MLSAAKIIFSRSCILLFNCSLSMEAPQIVGAIEFCFMFPWLMFWLDEAFLEGRVGKFFKDFSTSNYWFDFFPLGFLLLKMASYPLPLSLQSLSV